MKNLLKEEINDIKYLFGYKKGVVISEQDGLSNTPKQLFTYINGQKELNTTFLSGSGEIGKWVGEEVKNWCNTNATGDTVCVLGKSMDTETAKRMKLHSSKLAANNDGYKIVKVEPEYIGVFDETSGDDTIQKKHYFVTFYSKS